jgi:hypothetical protein
MQVTVKGIASLPVADIDPDFDRFDGSICHGTPRRISLHRHSPRRSAQTCVGLQGPPKSAAMKG